MSWTQAVEDSEMLDRDTRAMELGRLALKLNLTKEMILEARQNKGSLWSVKAKLLSLIVASENLLKVNDAVNLAKLEMATYKAQEK